MDKAERNSLLGILLAILVAAGVAVAGSQGGTKVLGVPLFALGVAIISLPVLSGWQWLTMISPVFITLLLTRISGIPILEKRADEKWGGQKEYEAYKARTPVLIPWPPRPS